MASGSFKIKNQVNLQPQNSVAVSDKGDLRYNSGTDKLEVYNGAVDSVVTETKSATLTNKTISGGTFTGTSSFPGSSSIDGSGNASFGGTLTSTGKASIGGATASATALYIYNSPVTGNAGVYGVDVNMTFDSSTTTSARNFYSAPVTAAAAFTLADLYHYASTDVSKGAGSAVTRQYGFYSADMTGAGTNYGFYSSVTSGANKYNFYAAGNADNYFAGPITSGTGAASTSGVLTLNGGTTAAYGSGVGLQKAGVTKGYIGTESFVLGSGTSDNISISSTPGGGSITFYTNGALTLSLNTSNNAVFNGIVSAAGAASSTAQFSINATTTLTGATQRGYEAVMTSSAAATAFQGYLSQLTANAGASVTNATNFFSNTYGPGAATTRFMGFRENAAASHPATNNASFSDNASFTGNWFINQVGTDPSTFGGTVSVATLKFGTAGTTGATPNTLGSNGPNAITTPNTWVAVQLSDGSTGYVPVWK